MLVVWQMAALGLALEEGDEGVWIQCAAKRNSTATAVAERKAFWEVQLLI